jgi:hypothetical protein
MIVNSQNIEFGYELISALPYAYYLHSKGKLTKTISGNDTECLYYFSPNHEINPAQRSWYNTPKAKDIPNIDIHKPYLNKEQFLAPPLRKQYANKEFKFKKETIVICNRYNIEWGKKPINYFNLETLEQMFKMLQDKYQIVYINIEGRNELYDNAPPIKLGDYELLKKYPKVINIHDIETKLSFNELQLNIFANCKKYITMNGGHAILASYFGGENIIMSKFGHPQSRELNPEINSFYRWYHEFGGQRIKHVNNETKLIEDIKSLWINKDPLINILIRTSSRPKYFDNCINSIIKQSYKNVNIYVSNDNNDKYIIKYPVHSISVKKTNSIEVINNNESYGKPFPYNLYINDLQSKVNKGVIMYLDDDDVLIDGALEEIAKESKKNDLVFWRVKDNKNIIPSDKNWNKAPVCCDISGIGFAFNSKYKKFAKWEPYKRGDYRVATNLYQNIKKIKFIDKILTRTQNGQNFGNRKDGNIKSNGWYITPEGKYWLGCNSIGMKKVSQGKMKKIDIKKVPKYLIKT